MAFGHEGFRSYTRIEPTNTESIHFIYTALASMLKASLDKKAKQTRKREKAKFAVAEVGSTTIADYKTVSIGSSLEKGSNVS